MYIYQFTAHVQLTTSKQDKTNTCKEERVGYAPKSPYGPIAHLCRKGYNKKYNHTSNVFTFIVKFYFILMYQCLP